MPKFVSQKQLREFRRVQEQKSRRDWTAENHEGAKRLAYELRNRSADSVARDHFRAHEAEQEKRDKATRERLTAMAFESVDAGSRVVVATSEPEYNYKEREGLRERIRFTKVNVDGEFHDYKVIETFENGILKSERAIKL